MVGGSWFWETGRKGSHRDLEMTTHNVFVVGHDAFSRCFESKRSALAGSSVLAVTYVRRDVKLGAPRKTPDSETGERTSG